MLKIKPFNLFFPSKSQKKHKYGSRLLNNITHTPHLTVLKMNVPEFEITTIPSIFESSPNTFDKTTNQLVKGLKIKHDNKFYIVGELAENEGIMPHKEINCSPDSLDYNIMMKSALLVANAKIGNPITVTTGFPFATYRLNRDEAQKNLIKDHLVEHDASTFSNGSVRKMVIEVKSGKILPEVLAASLAVRTIENSNQDFFMFSLGYGTFETMFSSPSSDFSTQRASSSALGLVYAVDLLRDELNNMQYTSMQNDRYFDLALQNAFIFLNRKKVDITDIRKEVLNRYYDNIISPHVKRAFTDKEFSKAKAIYLSGGGALYPELVARFMEEFKDIMEVKIPDNPNHLAVKGYCLTSAKINGEDTTQAVGIDLGNSSTIVCTIKPGTGDY